MASMFQCKGHNRNRNHSGDSILSSLLQPDRKMRNKHDQLDLILPAITTPEQFPKPLVRSLWKVFQEKVVCCFMLFTSTRCLLFSSKNIRVLGAELTKRGIVSRGGLWSD